MATGKIKTLFSDKEKTEALFPRTKLKAISDDSGIGLDALLENIDTAIDDCVHKTGDTMNGNLLMDGNLVKNLGEPQEDADAVPKAYADTKVSMTLLWVNASPTSIFAPQSVALALSAYDYVVIEFCLNPSVWNMKTSAWYRVGAGDSIVSVPDGNPVTYFRGLTVNTDGVSFANGQLGQNINNYQMIPLRIYGIKGVTA